jgi:hypothetical protein
MRSELRDRAASASALATFQRGGMLPIAGANDGNLAAAFAVSRQLDLQAEESVAHVRTRSSAGMVTGRRFRRRLIAECIQ